MKSNSISLTQADLAYIEANFTTLTVLCNAASENIARIGAEIRSGTRPAASYVLADGREFFPPDYLQLETDRERFETRLLNESRVQRIVPLDPQETWTAYLSGAYGVCLCSATLEHIVQKAALLQRIEALTVAPKEQDPRWLADLARAVDALDDLERPFSPNYDRNRFGKPPTRDSHINAVRLRYPAIAPTSDRKTS